MKKVLVCLILITSIFCRIYAQKLTVQEPEFSEEAVLVTSDSTGVLLDKENASSKTTVDAGLFIFGVGKAKCWIAIDGKSSTSSVKGHSETKLIIKADDNKTDPRSFINIIKFEIRSGERRYKAADAGLFGANSNNSSNIIDYNAKKYGESSYLLILKNLEPGEYGITMTDPNKNTNKNTYKISTFTVK